MHAVKHVDFLWITRYIHTTYSGVLAPFLFFVVDRIYIMQLLKDMKTVSSAPVSADRKWHLIDAEGLVLGRLASEISMILRGKHKPEFTPGLDFGDHVVVINAEKVLMTGKKRHEKTYYRHTGHPGGIKSITADKLLDGQHPTRVLHKAVERMISRNPLGRAQILKLHIYAGSEHPHAGQQPQPYDFLSKNKKNNGQKSENS